MPSDRTLASAPGELSVRWGRLVSPTILRTPGEAAWLAALATLRVATWRNLTPGVTVVTVNWNTASYLRTHLEAVKHFSPPDVSLVVMDNHSTDGSWSLLRHAPGITRLRLPRNLGHGAGLDVGVSLARTEIVVTLDVDAFPITEQWLETLVGPLDRGYVLVGGNPYNEFAHPSMLATRTRWLRGRSFRPDANTGLDVGQRLTREADGPVKLLPISESFGPGMVGSVYGDIVYHNFFSAHSQGMDAQQAGAHPVVESSDVQRSWDSAVDRFLAEIGK